MLKKVWIIAPFSNIDIVGVRNRFQYLCDRLHREGIEVTLFTSRFSHLKKEHVNSNIIREYPYKVVLVDEPGYRRNVSVQRAYSHFRFARNLKRMMASMENPDLMYCAYPTMDAASVAGRFAKRNSIPFIIDVQDTWPESISTAVNTANKMIKLAMIPFTKYANRIYRMADVIFAVSDTYAQRAKNSGSSIKEFVTVYIGAELANYDKTVLDKVNKQSDEYWVTYIGTLSHSYDIDTAIKAFAELKEQPHIKLQILGTGPDEERLVKLAKDLNVYDVNVHFYGFIQYEQLMSVLRHTDVALNSLTAGSKGTITNKLGDYVSAGLPILNSCQEKEVIDLVVDKGLGLNYPPGEARTLRNSIIQMINDAEYRKKCALNARKLAETSFDRQESYKKIVDKIKFLVEA